MSAIVFYKDSLNEFKCDIKVDGASLANSKARLVFEFENDKSYLFNGSISNEGHVEFNIPRLGDINESRGTAILEVIADSTYFEAWTSSFELKNKKKIEVNEVIVNSERKPTVMVENIVSENEPVVMKKRVFVESCGTKNRMFVKKSFGKYRKMKPSEKALVKEHLKFFTPTSKIEAWGQDVFEDPTSNHARYCMYEAQKIIG